ncbi:MAG: ATP-binding protein, partial [Frankia sp.]
AQEQSQIYGLLRSSSFTASDFRQFLSLDTQKDNEFGIFQDTASTSQTDQYRAVLTDNDVKASSDYIEAVLTAPTGQALPASAVPADKWARSTSAYVQKVDNLASDILLQASHGRINQLRSNLQRRALITGLLIVLVLGAALIAAVVVARSLIRPLLALRAAALDVAGRRLPEAVRRLRDSTDQRIDTEIESVGIDTDEEIGEVARAFDGVHREAVRLASEQAVLRNNVNAMFVNLSRRSQGLVERQLRLIDDLENREQDPDQLSNLFKLDHLATRMRRNNESLLVLAGTDTARRWSHPVPINEVVLAAISEVEQYTRVKQTGAASLSIAGHAVSDVVHLIAELLENATAYSPPATEVSVLSHSLGPGAGAMIEIVDHGIGMPAKDLERVNERLASPPVIDVTVSRTMGLFAVGRLAGRHGIRAQLRESDTGGITALIRLPARVVTGEDPADGHELENETTVNTRSLPRGGGPELGRPAIANLPGADSGAFPLVGTSANGNGSNYGNSLNGNQRHDQDDDLSDLGEITAGSYLDSDPDDEALGRRDDRDVFDPFNGGDRADDDRLSNPSAARSSFEPRNPQDPPTGPVGPFTGPQQIRPDDDRAGAPGARDGYLTNGFGPSGYSPGPREVRPSPDASPLPRRDLGGRYQGPSGRPDQGYSDQNYSDPAPSRTGPIGAGPNFVPAADRTEPDYSGSDLTGPIGAGPGASFTDPNFNPNFTDPNLVRPDDSGPNRTGPQTREPAPADYSRTGGPGEQSAHESEPADAESEAEETDATPIFDSVSAWFQRRTPSDPPAPRRAVSEPPAAATPARQPTPPASQPAPSQPTRSGVPPTRRPGVAQTANGGVPSFGPSPDAGRSTNGGFSGRPAPERAPTPQPAVAAAAAEQTWSSASDEGWRAAEAAREAANAGTTRSGLPIRTPKANLVPGTAEAAPRRL